MKGLYLRTKESRTCEILFRRDPFRALSKVGGKVFVFTDEKVLRLYGKKISRALPDAPLYAMPAGEGGKTPETLFALLRAMAAAGLCREDALVVVGGGVPGDVGGLAAALYMRGIRFVFVPTTLLAQADASVGGKTAVDFCGVKNLVGIIRQPDLVLLSPMFAATLPRRELVSGLGETVKYAALQGGLFEKLNAAPDLTDPAFLFSLVPEEVAFKADVVRRDPFDRSIRRCLNLGHTTAHAAELCDPALSHGECVLFGIFCEAAIAAKTGRGDGGYLSELQELCLRALGGSVMPHRIDVKALLLDKKNNKAQTVSVVAPVRRGEWEEISLPVGEYLGLLAGLGVTPC